MPETPDTHIVAALCADNGRDYSHWALTRLAPALRQVPLNKLGVGLGCWIGKDTEGTWNVKPESAKDRVCLLMNHSVQELDMFILRSVESRTPL